MSNHDEPQDAQTPNDAAQLDAAQLDQAAGGLPAVQAPAESTSLSIGSGAGKVTFNPFSISR